MQAFTTFHGTVKRLAPAALEPGALQAFHLMFPGFAELPSERGEPVPHVGMEADRRRFSGAMFVARPPLDRAKYCTVCVDASGNDGGALGQELRAYASPMTRHKLFVTDLGAPSIVVRDVERGWIPGNRLGIHVIDPDGELLERFHALGPIRALPGGCWRTQLDYVIEAVRIERTVDLRLPATQAWFFETFRDGWRPFWHKHGGRRIHRFHDMLPTLMTAALGGDASTDAIGRALRALGVHALIYPSARANPESIVYRDEVVRAVGFNLVTFGDQGLAGDDEPSMVFDDLEPWGESAFWPHLRCEVAELSDDLTLVDHLRGTWRLRGVREAHERYWKDGGYLGTCAGRTGVAF